MIGVKPAFNGRSLADGANADFDVVMVAPDGKTVAQTGLRYELLKIETSYQWYRQNGQWQFEPIKRTERVANGTLAVAADKPGHVSLPVKWGRYRLEVKTADPDGPITSLNFDAGFYAESSADTPDLLEIALDKKDYKPGDKLNVAVTARSAGRLTLNVFTDRLVASQSREREGRYRACVRAGRRRLGHRRLSGGDAAPAARRGGQAHARPRHRRAVVLDRPRRPHAAHEHESAAGAAAQFEAHRAAAYRRAEGRRRGARGGGRRRCRHSQSDPLQAAGARRLLSRPAPAHARKSAISTAS